MSSRITLSSLQTGGRSTRTCPVAAEHRRVSMHPRQCLQPVGVGQDGYFHKGAYCKTRQFSGKFETQGIERVPEQRWEIDLDCWQGSWVRNQSPEGPKGTPAGRRPFLVEALEEGPGTVCLGQAGCCLGRREGMGYGRTHELSCLAEFCRTPGPLRLCNTKGTEPSPFP